MQPILKVENIEKYYGNKGNLTKAIDGISFEVQKGEFIGVMGPSGSGKTTLLNTISTIDTVTSGHIYIEEQDISNLNRKQLTQFRREKLGFIFQEFNLLDTLTVYENIALGLTIQKENPKLIDEKVLRIAGQLEMTEILEKFPYEISGGQKQRAAAARAMINEPSLILADEPTGALDSKSANRLLESLTKLNEDLEATLLMVTHDAFSASYAKRILFIKDGRIFSELIKGRKGRKQFFGEILEVVSLLGGDLRDVY